MVLWWGSRKWPAQNCWRLALEGWDDWCPVLEEWDWCAVLGEEQDWCPVLEKGFLGEWWLGLEQPWWWSKVEIGWLGEA